MGLESPTHFTQAAPKLSKEQLSISTARLYQELSPPYPADLSDRRNHFGDYVDQRIALDYSYHYLPKRSRQLLQDSIVQDALQSPNNCTTCDANNLSKPIVLFTAGGMGAGKSHALKLLLDQKQVNLPHDFIWVDPDKLARKLPERQQYLEHNSESSSALLHPEAGFLQEIMSNYAKDTKRSLVIDGSLSDCNWFKKIMKQYRDAGYASEILFVYADEEIMVRRAAKRAKDTGRVTSREHIQRSREKSPRAVEALAKPDHVDRVRIVDNSKDGASPKIVYDSINDVDWQQGKRGLDMSHYVNR